MTTTAIALRFIMRETAVYLSRFASGPVAPQPPLRPRGHRSWLVDIRVAVAARDFHTDPSARLSRRAFLSPVGVQSAAADRQRLQHVGLLHCRHRVAHPPRTA